jgi:hypothetical protein
MPTKISKDSQSVIFILFTSNLSLMHLKAFWWIGILFFGLLVFQPTTCSAQDFKIQGSVIDGETSASVPFAQIGIKGTSIYTTADEQGHFSLTINSISDSITIFSFGYKVKTISLEKINLQKLRITLYPDIIESEIITIYQDEPQIRLVKRILKNKAQSHQNKLTALEYQQYEKIKIGDKDYEEIEKKWYIPKAFKFFFRNTDTLTQATYLPLFIIETVKQVWHKQPNKSKEEIIAASVSGLENPSLSRIVGDKTLSVYIYDNYLNLFNKNFISPISDNCLNHYTYQIIDTTQIDDYSCIKLKFTPKHKQGYTLSGHMWVVDSLYAVKSIEADIAVDANINFITGLSINQTYVQQENCWTKKDEEYFIHGELTVPLLGHRKFFATKSVFYNNILVNQTKEDAFYQTFGESELNPKAHKRDSLYWQESRPIGLTQNDIKLYQNTERLKDLPLFKSTLVLFTGYKGIGKWQLGPYFSLYSFNPVEGNRFRLGMRSTPKWSKNLYINTYGAFGTRDQRFKYGASVEYFFKKMPRNHIGIQIKEDINQLTWAQNYYRTQETILSTLFKISSSNKFVFNKQYKLFYSKEWKEGLLNTIHIQRNSMQALQELSFEKTNDQGYINELVSTELVLNTHWGIKEKYISGEYKRVSLGTAYPVFDLILIKGLKNFLGNEYDYFKSIISIKQRLKIGSLGYSRYRLEAGKFWGKLPYPLLELHNGNQTFLYDELSFNTMNFLEFASDQYASFFLTHFFDGFFFNKIPLLRKLKWRETISGKILYGSLDSKQHQVLVLPDNLYSLESIPFAEAGFGIDNIFKVIRVDFLWRLTYLDNPDIDRFKILVGLHLSF